MQAAFVFSLATWVLVVLEITPLMMFVKLIRLTSELLRTYKQYGTNEPGNNICMLITEDEPIFDASATDDILEVDENSYMKNQLGIERETLFSKRLRFPLAINNLYIHIGLRRSILKIILISEYVNYKIIYFLNLKTWSFLINNIIITLIIFVLNNITFASERWLEKDVLARVEVAFAFWISSRIQRLSLRTLKNVYRETYSSSLATVLNSNKGPAANEKK
uniref:Anoctamin n=1 Tax=Heterorhabditis bacteriophora TaxID=37862 RepID=A0A1I7WNW6_HETBA